MSAKKSAKTFKTPKGTLINKLYGNAQMIRKMGGKSDAKLNIELVQLVQKKTEKKTKY